MNRHSVQLILAQTIAILFAALLSLNVCPAQDLTQWQVAPKDGTGATIVDGRATLSSAKWISLQSPGESENVEFSARITVQEPARQFDFFGSSWSAWPPSDFGDQGYEAGLLVRTGNNSGYRVQVSHKYQEVALVKYPDGGYLRVVPCQVKQNQPVQVVVRVQGNEIVVRVDDRELIRYQDEFLPLTTGHVGIAASSLGKVLFENVKLDRLAAPAIKLTAAKPHTLNLSVRKWLGDRQWVFDGDEPILQLHHGADPSCFAKLKPGYKPQLLFDSHWGLENQGAFPEAASRWTEPVVNGGGATLSVNWSARNVKDRFTTQSKLAVGFDPVRGTYTYDVDSQLEVLAGEPFHFRYGFDFEHHTPLDPFRWQYLIARRHNGNLYHRPVYPIDPGPQNDLETYHGVRVWYGRHGEQMQIAPAVEYDIKPNANRDPKDASKSMQRKLNTAVCAAFYDTGVSFEPETAVPGTQLRVRYRYTGYPAAEAAELFKQSKIYDSPTLDPNHHYIFADEWPKLTFSQFSPLSESWVYGRTPFMTGHNQRPTYELEKNCGAGSGFAMKLGPASFGKANLPVPGTLTKGRYVVTALVKSINAFGPGGRLELEAAQAKTNKLLAQVKHYWGNGSFDWKRAGFVFEIPEDAGSLAVAFGNSGTGEMLVTDVEFRRLNDGEAIPSKILPKPTTVPPVYGNAPAGAIADYRMEEGKGNFVLNYAASPLGHLDLANLDWVVDSGRPALRFADNQTGRKDYRLDSGLNRHYLSHPSYAGRNTLPIALAGFHGGGSPMQGLTLAAWIKPAPEMGKSEHSGKGDVIGYGGRRFILSLRGQQAPYQLEARINVNDVITSETKIAADNWVHVALTAEPSNGQWHIRLYQDGKPVGAGTTKKFPADSPIVWSMILGSEIFYFHDAYYRGLIGRTLIFDRKLTDSEISQLVHP
ncbi:MAG: hypothetical protein JWM11_3368 [Planctomycetaceae bacterium]|nr:hypothetical protein [Planctomycetaceae bacterium]